MLVTTNCKQNCYDSYGHKKANNDHGKFTQDIFFCIELCHTRRFITNKLFSSFFHYKSQIVQLSGKFTSQIITRIYLLLSNASNFYSTDNLFSSLINLAYTSYSI